jgi:hypothetical protein
MQKSIVEHKDVRAVEDYVVTTLNGEVPIRRKLIKQYWYH